MSCDGSVNGRGQAAVLKMSDEIRERRFLVCGLALLFLFFGTLALFAKDNPALGLGKISILSSGDNFASDGKLPPDAHTLPGDAYDSPSGDGETSEQEVEEVEELAAMEKAKTSIDTSKTDADPGDTYSESVQRAGDVSVDGASEELDYSRVSAEEKEVLLSKLGVANSSTLSVDVNGWNMLSGPASAERRFTVCNGTVELKARSKLAVISISHRSDGIPEPRLHMKVTGRYMRMYAARVGADFHILQSLCAESMTLHETMKALKVDEATAHHLYANVDVAARARMQKMMAGTLLDVYDRILMLDDTVLVHPYTPDLFKIVPYGWLGAVFERQKTVAPYAKGWVNAITRKFCSHYLRLKCDHMDNMFNSGVMLFDKSLKSSLFDARYFHKYTYVGGFYDQAYFNAMLVQHRLKFFDLGLSFNIVGSLIKTRKADQKRIFGLTNEQVCMPHMTRMIKHRVAQAKVFENIYRRSIRTGRPRCKYQCGEYGCWVPHGSLPKPKKPFTVHTSPIQKGERWVRSAHRWIKSHGLI